MDQNQELARLHALQLKMLRACVAICERHGIRYFLLGGSALGAVRHRGFIPWDDDIDIGMPRPDYDRFMSIAKSELEPHLFLQTPDSDLAYPLHFAKLRDSTTTFIQRSVAHLPMNHGISVDIFPLDGCSSNHMVNKFHYLVFQALRSMHHYKFRMRSQRRGKAVIEALSVLFPKRLLRWGAEKLMRRSNYDESLWVINWCGSWGLREAVERTVFDSGKQLSFEGMSVAVPKQVESYLSSLYGDYMKLPPEEKRIRPHSADIVDLDRSYTSYQNSSP